LVAKLADLLCVGGLVGGHIADLGGFQRGTSAGSSNRTRVSCLLPFTSLSVWNIGVMIVFDREYSLKICVQISTTLILLLRHKSSRSSVAFVIHLVQSSVLVLHDERAAAADASVHIVPVSHLLCVPYGLSILLVIFLRLVDFVHGVPVSRVLVVLTSMT